MCDTLGRISQNGTIFAKNSDRSPNEVQVLEYHEAKSGLTGMVDCTYISIPQVPNTYAVLLSRPAWMWGAEIGVNEYGLCIGNEAVFTTGAYGKTGLTGMDLLRLALERCKTAMEAVEMIVRLLEQYGQGGNCGYDHKFYYDNGFLIMDRTGLYVLETAGKQWVYKQYTAASISNRLSIGADGDRYSTGKAFDFKRRFTEPVYTGFSGSASRIAQTGSYLPVADTISGAMAALRSHDDSAVPFCKGSVSSACMHYGGAVGDHTTASTVVALEKSRTVVWSTGCSLPCVSLYKPWLFGAEVILPVILPEDPAGRDYWMEAEIFRRSLLGKKLPAQFYAQRDAIQAKWIQLAATTANEDFSAFSQACLEEEHRFYDFWKNQPLENDAAGAAFRGRWDKKNRVLFSHEP